jgi:hypothetical protein
MNISNFKVEDENIPKNLLVFGSSPNLIIKSKSDEYYEGLLPYNIELIYSWGYSNSLVPIKCT